MNGTACQACGKEKAARTKREAKAIGFAELLAQHGATLIEDGYKGAHHRHRIVCASGHETVTTHTHLQQGGRPCRACARQDPKVAEAAFRARVASLGGTVVGAYVNNRTPVKLLCSEGHECQPRPGNVMLRSGFCRICAQQDSETARLAFQRRLKELRVTLVDTNWRGSFERYKAVCAAGHECFPLPSFVAQGGGPCRFCKGQIFDVFYVVRDGLRAVIKFGITSGNGRSRLRVHERDGFDDVVRLHIGLPGETAPQLERNIMATLDAARVPPVRGREYFPEAALPIVLDLVDNHPALRRTTR
ncbi:hypothetical protein HTV80_00145 [Streptomyces sp. Vc74B-19]|uniref:hypothetical protein n=1 Tax=Streptomyces sp. Vc74B-19 TaxID=2741324 RepID=UPI001BFC60CE|nr:hypothetical protein [Streptomyces sp. Vc74B-19]MBT3161524.1 hypothetical protein [Streptomyces sp. Vc74B-19]